MTTTSVSTVRTSTVSAPCSKACRMWTMILVYASSWLQSSIGTDSPHADTAYPDVTQTDFVGGQVNDSILDVKKANSSFLFIWSHQKFSNCLVSWLSQTLTPFPLFSWVDSFRLSWMYSSHTTSNLLVSWRYLSRWGMNTLSVYILKVLTLKVGRQLTRDPSRTLQSYAEGGSVFVDWPRQGSRSDFVSGRYSIPKSEREGGNDCIWWAKNSLRSLTVLHCDIELAKQCTLFSSTFIFPFFGDIFDWGVLKSAREFLLMGSWIEVVRSRRTFLTKSLYCFLPVSSKERTVCTTDLSTQFRLSRVKCY